jgi:hypothetical protein
MVEFPKLFKMPLYLNFILFDSNILSVLYLFKTHEVGREWCNYHFDWPYRFESRIRILVVVKIKYSDGVIIM